MATSGTTVFNPDIVEIFEEAFERCGLQLRTGYDVKTARRSYNLLVAEWANRGLNLWTLEEGSQLLTYNTATYVLPTDTVDIFDCSIRTNVGTADQRDISISPMSSTTYQQLPTKLDTGQPLRYLVRRTAAPSVTLWLVPDNNGPYTLVYWRLRRIQDAGSSVASTADVPFRFLPALVAGLSYQIAMKRPEANARLGILKQDYEEQFQLAADEDRDRSSIHLVPGVR